VNRDLNTPIEELMIKKLGKMYEKFAYTRGRDKILMKLLKEILIGEVNKLLKQNGMIDPPFDPFKISCIGSAQIKVKFLPKEEIGVEGSIETYENGFIIKIDKTLLDKSSRVVRLRTTMTHELMHTFFYDTTKTTPSKIGQRSPQRKEFMMEEELCYYLTREFLVPTLSINSLLAKKSHLLLPSIENVGFLKKIFVVSSDIIAYRMIKDLSFWDAIFIKFTNNGEIYKTITQLKNKTNKHFNKLRIPPYVPFSSSNNWLNTLSNNCMNALRLKKVKGMVNFEGMSLPIESKVDSVNPLSIITIVSDVSENCEENFMTNK